MKNGIAILTVFLLTSLNAFAQGPEDALRLGQPAYGVSARSMSMGNAMIGLSQGFDATYFNPAGLAQSYQSQVSMGLNFLGYNNAANYLNTSGSLSSSQTDLSNFGLVYPFPTTRGSFVIALGYNRGSDFNSALSFNAFNSKSSIVPSLYYDDYPYDANYDIPYFVGLEDSATHGIALNKNVQQTGTVYETGGLNNWLAAGAVDIGQDFSIGLTLDILSGSYHYARTFTETDPLGNWPITLPLSDLPDAKGLGSFVLNDNIDQDLSGWNAKAGFLYRLPGDDGKIIARFGGTIEFPTFMTVNEKYSDAGTANFLTGSSYSYTTPGGNNNYDVTTPFKFGFGASGEISILTIAADVQYVDWTEMQFSTSAEPTLDDSYISNLNSEIKQQFRATTNFHVGGEIALMNSDYSSFVPYIRGGFGYSESPYIGDGSAQAQKYASGGIGFKIQNSIDLDLAYQYGWWNTSEILYTDPPSTGAPNGTAYGTTSKITNSNFMFTFEYNF